MGTPNKVSSLLFDAAQYVLSQHSDDSKVKIAKGLLALSGKYGAFVELLNQQLANRLVLEAEKEESIQFYNTHLQKQRTYVATVLEQEDRLSHGKTFETLLNLVTFFDRIHTRQWENAWSLVSQLQLLPQSEDEIQWALKNFHALDDTIKRNFHFILLGA